MPPPTSSSLPAYSQPLGRRLNTQLLEHRERERQKERERWREWDHCHIKSSSRQNYKNGPLSSGWPGRLATTCSAFLCDMALCHFPQRDTEGRATSKQSSGASGWRNKQESGIKRHFEGAHMKAAGSNACCGKKQRWILIVIEEQAIKTNIRSTGRLYRFAYTAVFPPSIWTATVSSETEEEDEREKEEEQLKTDTQSLGSWKFNSRTWSETRRCLQGSSCSGSFSQQDQSCFKVNQLLID